MATALRPTGKRVAALRQARAKLRKLKDEDLIELHASGHESAFDELVRRFHRQITRFMCGRVGDYPDTEEAVQDVFVKVHRNAHKYRREKGSFNHWIYVIAKRRCLNVYRDRNRKNKHEVEWPRGERNAWEDDGEDMEFADYSLAPDQLFEEHEFEDSINEALDNLSPQHREAFVLRHFSGVSYVHIASQEDINVGTAKSRVNRALTNIEKILRRSLRFRKPTK